MGPKEVIRAQQALAGANVTNMSPDHLEEGETTDKLVVAIKGSVTDALGRLASAKLIPWPGDKQSTTPLVVESSVIFMGGTEPYRYELSGAIVLIDKPEEPTTADDNAPTV